MLQESATSNSSVKESPVNLPFRTLHGLPDDRPHELFDHSFPSEEVNVGTFNEGNFVTIYSFVILNDQFFQCGCCQYSIYDIL